MFAFVRMRAGRGSRRPSTRFAHWLRAARKGGPGGFAAGAVVFLGQKNLFLSCPKQNRQKMANTNFTGRMGSFFWLAASGTEGEKKTKRKHFWELEKSK